MTAFSGLRFSVMVSVPLVLMLAGCGVSTEEHQAVVDDLLATRMSLETTRDTLAATEAGLQEMTDARESAIDEMNQARQRLDTAEKNLSETKKKMADLESSLEEARKNNQQLADDVKQSGARVKSLTEEVEQLKKMAAAFCEAAKKGAEDLAGAIEAYRAFEKAYPKSILSPAAVSKIKQIEQLMKDAQKRTEKAEPAPQEDG